MSLALLSRLARTSTFAAIVVLAVPGAVYADSFSYSGPPVAIPDSPGANTPGAQVGAPITVSGISQPVGSVTISIDGTACSTTAGDPAVGIDHSFVNDLRITLRSPTGTEVIVIDRTDGSGNNFCQVVLDDASAGPSIQTALTADAPFTGSWQPNAPLSAFAGETANGDWTLLAEDFFIGDTGSIRAWTINITPRVIPLPPTSIPTLSEWGMISLASLLALGTLLTLRRKRQ
jgi:subtilisin-like proprotein convertase family protein